MKIYSLLNLEFISKFNHKEMFFKLQEVPFYVQGIKIETINLDLLLFKVDLKVS